MQVLSINQSGVTCATFILQLNNVKNIWSMQMQPKFLLVRILRYVLSCYHSAKWSMNMTYVSLLSIYWTENFMEQEYSCRTGNLTFVSAIRRMYTTDPPMTVQPFLPITIALRMQL